MARPKKTIAELKQSGTFRKDRHSEEDSIETDLAGGKPEQPPGLSKEQKKVWSYVVKNWLEDSIGEIDSVALQGLVEWFGLWRETHEMIRDADFDDRNTLIKTANVCWKNVEAMLSKFGMTPRDRAMLRGIGSSKVSDSDDPLTWFDSSN